MGIDLGVVSFFQEHVEAFVVGSLCAVSEDGLFVVDVAGTELCWLSFYF